MNRKSAVLKVLLEVADVYWFKTTSQIMQRESTQFILALKLRVFHICSELESYSPEAFGTTHRNPIQAYKPDGKSKKKKKAFGEDRSF